MTPEIKGLIAILLGLLFCFAGYKVQKFLIMLIWFYIGFQLAHTYGPNFVSNNSVLLIVEIIAGFIFASIGFKIEKLAILITVAYLTYITISPYITGFEKEMNTLIVGVASLLAGGLAIFFIKPILIIVTSLAGCGIIYQYLPAVLNLGDKIYMIIAIVIGLTGIYAQFKSN